MTFKEFLEEEQIKQNIVEYLWIAEQDIDENYLRRLNEGNVDDILKKFGLQIHKNKKGLIQYLIASGKNIAQFMGYALKKDKTGMKAVMDKVTREDVVDFLLKLDLATFHIITPFIHFANATTGWHLWSAVEHRAKGSEEIVQSVKKALTDVKEKLPKIITPKSKAKAHVGHIRAVEKALPESMHEGLNVSHTNVSSGKFWEMAKKPKTAKNFGKLMRYHDWTYNYSDDSKSRNAGKKETVEINKWIGLNSEFKDAHKKFVTMANKRTGKMTSKEVWKGKTSKPTKQSLANDKARDKRMRGSNAAIDRGYLEIKNRNRKEGRR